ncbi:MAG TPA: hypothetical protein VF308_09345 [Caldimonas sp.]
MPLSLLHRLLHTLARRAQPGTRTTARLGASLTAAREDFRAALDDMAKVQTSDTLDLIRKARSCNELWHLRSAVFSLVSCHHDQDEAKRRLSRIDRHFPSRVRRAGPAARAAADSHESVPPL